MKWTHITTTSPSQIGKTGLIAGLVSGFIFSIVAWGIDFAILTVSRVVYPWIKFLPAAILVIGLAGLVGFLAAKSGRGLPTFLLWTGWGLGSFFVASYLPYRISERIIQTLNPMLGAEISYPIPPMQDTRMIFGLIVVLVISAIVSFLFPNVIDQLHMGVDLGPIIVSLLVWSALFALDGFVLDSIYNAPLRTPLALTAETIETARANEALLDKGSEASKLHILAMKPLRAVFRRPYYISLKTYEDFNESMQVWVDFDGFWYTCNVANNQVINCK